MSTTNTSEFQPQISPPELELLAKLSAHTTAKWRQQVEVKTPFSSFFLDLACTASPGRQIGVECDGWDFHKDKARDFCRDALILATGEVACIFRIGAWAVNRHNLQLDWLWVISRREPQIFTTEKLKFIDDLMSAMVNRDRITLGRFTGFMSILTPKSKGVKEFIDFAGRHVEKSFLGLVDAAKKSGVAA